METWNVKEITLIQRGIGHPAREARLPCATVSWHPPSDIPSAAPTSEDPGFLLASGIPVERLADIDWVPTDVRFNAEGYMEAREFQVRGWDADSRSGTVKFTIP